MAATANADRSLMIIKLLILFVIMAEGILAQNVRPLSSYRGEHLLPAVNQFGSTKISAFEALFDVTYPSGGKGRSDILVAFDQVNGHYIWYFRQINNDESRADSLATSFAQNAIHYGAAERMIVFWNRGAALSIRESVKRSDSLDHAVQAALQEIESSLHELERGASVPSGQEFLQIRHPFFGPDYYPSKPNARLPDPRLVNVAHVGDNWEITMELASQATMVFG